MSFVGTPPVGDAVQGAALATSLEQGCSPSWLVKITEPEEGTGDVLLARSLCLPFLLWAVWLPLLDGTCPAIGVREGSLAG
jgi:hypothetical protein